MWTSVGDRFCPNTSRKACLDVQDFLNHGKPEREKGQSLLRRGTAPFTAPFGVATSISGIKREIFIYLNQARPIC